VTSKFNRVCVNMLISLALLFSFSFAAVTIDPVQTIQVNVPGALGIVDAIFSTTEDEYLILTSGRKMLYDSSDTVPIFNLDNILEIRNAKYVNGFLNQGILYILYQSNPEFQKSYLLLVNINRQTYSLVALGMVRILSSAFDTDKLDIYALLQFSDEVSNFKILRRNLITGSTVLRSFPLKRWGFESWDTAVIKVGYNQSGNSEFIYIAGRANMSSLDLFVYTVVQLISLTFTHVPYPFLYVDTIQVSTSFPKSFIKIYVFARADTKDATWFQYLYNKSANTFQTVNNYNMSRPGEDVMIWSEIGSTSGCLLYAAADRVFSQAGHPTMNFPEFTYFLGATVSMKNMISGRNEDGDHILIVPEPYFKDGNLSIYYFLESKFICVTH